MSFVARDAHYRITDKAGNSHVECRRVWDADRLTAALKQQHAKEGGRVEFISADEYRRQKTTKRSNAQ